MRTRDEGNLPLISPGCFGTSWSAQSSDSVLHVVTLETLGNGTGGEEKASALLYGVSPATPFLSFIVF